jgi:hypothetical protein
MWAGWTLKIKNPVVLKKGYRRARSPKCRNWAMPNGRRRLHGGLSTGPKTEAGRARSLAALRKGRKSWLAQRKKLTLEIGSIQE